MKRRRYVMWMLVAVVSGAGVGAVTADRDGRSAGTESWEHVDPSLARLNEQLSRRGSAVPPARVRLTTRKAIVEDPASADYDPLLVSAAYDRSVRDIYAAEPRSEKFAVEREATIGATVSADLKRYFPEAELRGVDCRTSSCVLTLRAPAAQFREVYSFIQFPVLGLVQNRGYAATDDPAVVEITMGVLFSKEQRDHAAYAEWYRETRAEQLPALREIGWWPAETP